jgi:hypothetical protein
MNVGNSYWEYDEDDTFYKYVYFLWQLPVKMSNRMDPSQFFYTCLKKYYNLF